MSGPGNSNPESVLKNESMLKPANLAVCFSLLATRYEAPPRNAEREALPHAPTEPRNKSFSFFRMVRLLKKMLAYHCIRWYETGISLPGTDAGFLKQ